MSSITGPQALEELTNHSKRLKDSIVETRELIRQKKEQGEKSFLQTIKGPEISFFASELCHYLETNSK